MSTTAVAKRHEITDRAFKDIVTREKAAEDAKTARLRALRLARDAAEEAPAEPAKAAPKAKAPKRRSFS